MLQLMITILPFVISIFSFFLVVSMVHTYHPEKTIRKTYVRINNTLKEKKTGFFNYEETKKFLMANGAGFHYGQWIDPIKYLVLQICTASVMFILGIGLHFSIGIVFFGFGFFLPGMMLRYLNREDNRKMIKDLQLLYDALQVQIRSGVHVTHALTECHHNIQKGRLRTALEEMAGELYIKNSLEECIHTFNQKFDSVFIDSLCLILQQAQETGQAVDLLRDMTAQIDDMRTALQLKRKEQLNRTTTFCLLGIMAAILVVVIYACTVTMFQSAGSF